MREHTATAGGIGLIGLATYGTYALSGNVLLVLLVAIGGLVLFDRLTRT